MVITGPNSVELLGLNGKVKYCGLEEHEFKDIDATQANEYRTKWQ